ncbi:MAG: P-loop NTPase fold protein [bacterium]
MQPVISNELNSKKNIKKELIKVLDYKEPLGIIIKGEWGVGKTYFWKEFTDNYPKESKKNIAYVSVFSKGSIADIQESIMIQISSFYNLTDKASKFKKTIKDLIPSNKIYMTLSTITALASIFAEKAAKDKFNNLIVCFDDFERLSKTIDHEALLGYISYLKEHFSCKVVIILNEKEFKDKNKDNNSNVNNIYDKYKEKIIDKELSYNPTYEENFNLIESKLKINEYKEELLNFLKKFNINNLRIIQQLIMILNEFEFIEPLNNIDKKIKIKFIGDLINLAYVKIKFNFTDFEELANYDYLKNAQKLIGGTNGDKIDNKNNKDDKNEEIIFFLERFKHYNSFNINEIMSLITSYLKTSILDQNSFKKILGQENERYLNSKKKEEFESYFNKVNYDFNYRFEDFKQDTIKFLEDNKNIILKIFDIDAFTRYMLLIFSYIDLFKNLNSNINNTNKEFYEEYIVEIFKKFIDNSQDELIKRSAIEEIINEKFKNFSDSIKNSLTDYINKKKMQGFNYDSLEKLKNIIETILSEIGYDPYKISVLNNIPEDKLKHFILNNEYFTGLCARFYVFVQSSTYFSQFNEKFIKILEEIGQDEKYKFKIELIKKQISMISNITYMEKAMKNIWKRQ